MATDNMESSSLEENFDKSDESEHKEEGEGE
jgi:hypothetical protein